MSDLKELQESARGFTVLYAEDNEALRLNATKLLKKFFDTVYVAPDGQEALEIFKREQIDILITDIKMPRMDGFELCENIKKIDAKTRFIIMSAFDDKAFLVRAIEDGIFSFLKKPVNVTELTSTLLKAIHHIKQEQEKELFFLHLKNVFNYQGSMVLMLNRRDAVLANQIFLNFFDVESVEEFVAEYGDLGKQFLEHDGFLYNHGEIDWYDVIELNEKKLFHIKMQNREGRTRHFILKYQGIPEKEGHGIVSFDDVTELNLLNLFDEKQTKSDVKVEDSRALFDLLEVLQRNSAQIEVHNYYKGLSITNNAIISDVNHESLTIKSTFLQLKAMQFEQKAFIVSEALPQHLECSNVIKIGFEKQTAELKGLRFTETSPVKRKTIRVIPDEKQTVSLFIRENRFHGDVSIEDISLDAVKLKLNALPAGLEKGDEVILDIVLELDKRPLIINTKATMLRKSESRHSFSVVFIFVDIKKNELVKYITKRQMAIIREFKGLQNG
jgi:CheY-like chemotaxis protein